MDKLFAQEAAEITRYFPDLSLSKKDDQDIVIGQLPLIDELGNLVDQYQIEIHPVREYPNRFPKVFETGKRIPKNFDWHVFEQDGSCCIKPPPEQMVICKDGITLVDFIKIEVIPYFFNQSHREKFGYYLNERSHGPKGVFEYYDEVLKGNGNVRMVVECLLFIAGGKTPRRTDYCFCGKKEKYRRCHREVYVILSKVDPWRLYCDAADFAQINNLDDLFIKAMSKLKKINQAKL